MKVEEYIQKFQLNEGVNFNYALFLNYLKREFYARLELYKDDMTTEKFYDVIDQMSEKWEMIVAESESVIPEFLWEILYYKIIMKRFYKIFTEFAEYKDEIQKWNIATLVQELKDIAKNRGDIRIESFISRRSRDLKYDPVNFDKNSIGEIELKANPLLIELERLLYKGKYFSDYKIHLLYSELNSQLRRVAVSKIKTGTIVQENDKLRDIPYINFKLNLTYLEYKECFDYFGLDINKNTKKDVNSKYGELYKKLHPNNGGNVDEFIQLARMRNSCLEYLILVKNN
jgi:hypothetical protein